MTLLNRHSQSARKLEYASGCYYYSQVEPQSYKTNEKTTTVNLMEQSKWVDESERIGILNIIQYEPHPFRYKQTDRKMMRDLQGKVNNMTELGKTAKVHRPWNTQADATTGLKSRHEVKMYKGRETQGMRRPTA